MTQIARKLGKHTPRHDDRTLQFANYVEKALPPPPTAVNWDAKIGASWGMMKNDVLGDCTIAAAGHMIALWTTYSSTKVVPTDAEIVAGYSAVTGYNPVTGANDNGAVETDVLNYWKNHGIGGHKILGYTALEPSNLNHVKDSVSLFGGTYIGLNLPVSCQNQKVWSVPPGGPHGKGAPGSWGGHAVPVVAYDASGLTVVTWGGLQTMTWGFWSTYCDEAYAVLSHDWLNVHGQTPNGFNLAALQADLLLLK